MKRELVVFEQGRPYNERPAWAVVGAGGRLGKVRYWTSLGKYVFEPAAACASITLRQLRAIADFLDERSAA